MEKTFATCKKTDAREGCHHFYATDVAELFPAPASRGHCCNISQGLTFCWVHLWHHMLPIPRRPEDNIRTSRAFPEKQNRRFNKNCTLTFNSSSKWKVRVASVNTKMPQCSSEETAGLDHGETPGISQTAIKRRDVQPH